MNPEIITDRLKKSPHTFAFVLGGTIRLMQDKYRAELMMRDCPQAFIGHYLTGVDPAWVAEDVEYAARELGYAAA